MAPHTPKTMSSRLMTMKFMQRSAASRTSSSPSTPHSGPPSKKIRLSNGARASAHGTPDHEILKTALEAEAKKQQDALDKAALYTGETKWVLSFKDPVGGGRQDALEVRHAGFAEIDAGGDEDESEQEEARPMRMQFGGGLKKKHVQTCTAPENAYPDSESEASSESDYDSDDPTAALIRETKRQMAAQKHEARRARGEKPNSGPATPKAPPRMLDEDMNVGGLKSLSGGQRRGAPARDMSHVECYRCGQKGHMRDQCRQGNRGQGREGGEGGGQGIARVRF